MIPQVTVAICTYHRPEWLRRCLQSLRDQDLDREKFRILVVDNYGENACEELADSFHADYVHEAIPGLSQARNRAASEVTTEWIFYLDDDALAHPNMLSEFLRLVNGNEVQVIGGRYEHYFASPPSRWVLRYYREAVRASPASGLVELSSNEYLSGGIMAARTELVRAHPFRTDLGMKELLPGFGEENEWQDRLRRAQVPIHYSENIAMDHLVQPHKQSIRNRLELAYAHGQYHARSQVQSKGEERGFLAQFLKVMFITLPYDLARVIFKSGFYWQNGLISTAGKIAFLRGKHLSAVSEESR